MDWVSPLRSADGLTVSRACDGCQAVEMFGKDPDGIHVVLLDRTMPNLDGEEAFRQIRRIRPNAQVIWMSGYSEELTGHRFSERGLAGFLHKPFEPMALLERVRRVIEAGENGPGRREARGSS